MIAMTAISNWKESSVVTYYCDADISIGRSKVVIAWIEDWRERPIGYFNFKKRKIRGLYRARTPSGLSSHTTIKRKHFAKSFVQPLNY